MFRILKWYVSFLCHFLFQIMIDHCVCHDNRRNFGDREYILILCAKLGNLVWMSWRYTYETLPFSAKTAIRFNSADVVRIFGWLCHQTSTYSHRDTRISAVSIDVDCRKWLIYIGWSKWILIWQYEKVDTRIHSLDSVKMSIIITQSIRTATNCMEVLSLSTKIHAVHELGSISDREWDL